MANPEETQDFSSYHDQLFNHMLRVNIYTPVCIFFPLPEECSKNVIIKRLEGGLDQLSIGFPWLTGQVVKSDSANGQTEHLRLVPMNKSCRLIIKDLGNEQGIPSMADLQQAGFPVHMIEGEIFTPLIGVPNGRPGDLCAAWFAQATFIKGGLVLGFAGEHSTMDGHGTGQVIRLVDKACHGEPFSKEELTEGNRTRGTTVPLLDLEDYRAGPELDYLVQKTNDQKYVTDSNAAAKCSWTYVQFSASEVSKLKTHASASQTTSKEPNEIPITTNDVLTAFIWQRIVCARAPRLEPNATSTLGRAVDVRSALSISSSYIGNMSNHTYTTLSCSSIVSAPLQTIASLLRKALEPKSVAYGIRSLATHLATTDDKSLVHYGANMDFSRDIFLSSWARLPCYKHDFNLGLGLPLSVRRPGFMPMEGLTYLMPMDNNGGMTAMLCLRDKDLAALRADAEFAKYSTWVG